MDDPYGKLITDGVTAQLNAQTLERVRRLIGEHRQARPCEELEDLCTALRAIGFEIPIMWCQGYDWATHEDCGLKLHHNGECRSQ